VRAGAIGGFLLVEYHKSSAPISPCPHLLIKLMLI